MVEFYKGYKIVRRVNSKKYFVLDRGNHPVFLANNTKFCKELIDSYIKGEQWAIEKALVGLTTVGSESFPEIKFPSEIKTIQVVLIDGSKVMVNKDELISLWKTDKVSLQEAGSCLTILLGWHPDRACEAWDILQKI